MKTVLAKCPGTCGEWVQGINNGIPFLVDCPVDRYTEVLTTLSPERSEWYFPLYKQKVKKALDILLKDNKLEAFGGGSIIFLKELPEGKGMASSTADITVTIASVLNCLGIEPLPKEISRIALLVEPSDGVMFPGISEMDYIGGSYVNTLGFAVPATFLALDWGGVVETLEFNSRVNLSQHYRRYQKETSGALNLFRRGIGKRDLEMMANASTISAFCNLEVNPKPFFKKFLKWVKTKGGLGLIGAHSGTLLAGVFPLDFNMTNLALEVGEIFKPENIQIFHSVNGGVRIEKNSTSAESSNITIKRIEVPHARRKFEMG